MRAGMRAAIRRAATARFPQARFASGADDIVEEEVPITPTSEGKETIKGSGEHFEFKAETQQLLDIVIRSVYTDKEIYVRELISNASDALEKRRHLEMVQPEEYGPQEGDEPPCIKIDVNSDTRQFIITDTGIGMTKEELIANIGTICSSGSKAFVKKLQEGANAADSIIGQFGVGFYSAFMIAKHIKIYTRSAQHGSTGWCWESDGTGAFKISEAEGVGKGTKIVCDVRETEVAFCAQTVIERIIKKYSNFVAYEIFLNNARINTVEALWMKPKDEVTEEEHTEFYKFIANAYDKPRFKMHYSIDCPLNINALMYVPMSHTERMNLQRMEPGLSLYCRKVLIQAKCRSLVPEYLRFVKGVVDSEDIPLNLSRESTQDSALMRKLSSVITKKILKWLHDESVRDPEGYTQFFDFFGQFLKEGVCTDALNKTDLARLLRFNSSACDNNNASVSFDDYIARMPENQTNIYFLQTQSRDAGLASPYYEAFKAKGIEVIFMTHPADHIVMTHLDMYKKHKIVSCESADPGENEGKNVESEEIENLMKKELSAEQGKELVDYVQRVLQNKVQSVKMSTRLTSSPCIITDHEQASMQKFMKSHGIVAGEGMEPTKYHLQLNPKHEIVRKLYTIAIKNQDDRSVDLGKLIAEQMFDNALIAANLLDDPRSIINRVTNLMEQALHSTPEPLNLEKPEKSE
eukprot:TRINITY_DN42559_c0_g1_i1.p1 TRINITY_DN42559_c0_g1~~TRINITY_DN42559_c0_g1_i1.p1  ORF type:complete len:706 (+),score=341.75 TRINITY_DN42559_c0_g1_i1:43-2118(+)